MPRSVQISEEESLDLDSTDSPRLVGSLQDRSCIQEKWPFLKVGLAEAWAEVRKTDLIRLEGVLYYQSKTFLRSLSFARGKMSFLNDLTNFFFGILLQLVHFQVPERM